MQQKTPCLSVVAGSLVQSAWARRVTPGGSLCLVASNTFENSRRKETTSLFNPVFKYLTWKAFMCICNPC